jgi:GT2 family glycosyltransferase
MELSIVLVTYNSEKFILNCLNSIIRATKGIGHEVIVVDNHSTDKTLNLVKGFLNSLEIIENAENEGFAKAVNRGLKKSSGEFCLLINPDIIVHSDSLEPMISFMRRNPGIGICGCKLLNKDGSLQYSKGSFPTLFSILTRIVLPRKMRRYHLWGYNKAGKCDWVTGALMLIRGRLIERVGYLDEKYFVYYEDVDYCLQAKRSGFEIFYYPKVEAYHQHPHAISKRNFPIENEIRKSCLYYFEKNNQFLSSRILYFLSRHFEQRVSFPDN